MSIKLRKLENGKTVFDVRVQYDNLRVQRTVPSTLTNAKRVESRLLQDFVNGKYDLVQNKENPKFKEYAKGYKSSVTWQKSYKNTLRCIKHLSGYFGEKRLTEITSNDFLKYRSERLEKVSPATINRERSCLLRILNIAIKDKNIVLNENPLEGIKPLKETPAEDRVLTIDEYHQLLEVAPEYFRRILFFACNTGMRKMEILNLQFGRIKNFLHGFFVELLDTKSGEKEYVPLSESVVELLRVIAEEEEITLNNIKNHNKKKYVFRGLNTDRLLSVRKPMERTFKEARVELRPFHTFRHFWTQSMFLAGTDPATIQKIGRWRDFETMLKYCYTTKPQEHEAVNQLSKMLEKKPSILNMRRQYNGNDGIYDQ
jgi:integrase